MMRRHGAVVLRPVVIFKATDRTVAMPIRCRTHAVAPLAVRRPVCAARTVDLREFGYQATVHFWQRELAAPMIGVARMTGCRPIGSVQEPPVPRAKQRVVVHVASVTRPTRVMRIGRPIRVVWRASTTSCTSPSSRVAAGGTGVSVVRIVCTSCCAG